MQESEFVRIDLEHDFSIILGRTGMIVRTNQPPLDDRVFLDAEAAGQLARTILAWDFT